MPTKPKPRALPKGRVMFTTEDFEAWGFTKNAGIFISLPHFPCAVIPCATCEALRKELAEAKKAIESASWKKTKTNQTKL